MDKKTKLLAVMLFTFMLFPLLSATTTLVKPVANSNHSASLDVNCTTDVGAMDNATIWYNASGVSDTSLTTIDNDTTDDTEFTESSVDISSLSDAKTYEFWCQVQNSTDQENSSTNTGITIDNNDPSCSVSVATPTIIFKGTQNIDWSSSDSLELVSTNVYIDGPEDHSTLHYTDSSATDKVLTGQDTAYEGDWTVNVTATDRAGNTCEKETTFETKPLGERIEQPQPEPEKGKGGMWIIVVIAIIGIIWYANSKK